ncbi:MAG: hypothetical protein HY283_03990 [Nitrospirae bacterium]|nr:hypothetical protein [Nitrospirota bacterium]
MRKSQIRRTALLIMLVYLFLSGFMMTGMGEHVAEHGHDTHHTAQHASFVCNWMCASSSFVHTSDHVLDQTAQPALETLAVHHEHFLNPLSIFSFRIRPPPVSLS